MAREGGLGTLVPYHRTLPLWSQPAPGSLSVFFRRGRGRGREGLWSLITAPCHCEAIQPLGPCLLSSGEGGGGGGGEGAREGGTLVTYHSTLLCSQVEPPSPWVPVCCLIFGLFCFVSLLLFGFLFCSISVFSSPQ